MNIESTRTVALLSTIAILANCGAGNSDDSDNNKADAEFYSDFASVTSDGEISLSSLKEKKAGTYECESGIGCGAYAVGFAADGENFRAISGFHAADDFTSQPQAVSNFYSTHYEYTRIDEVYDATNAGTTAQYGQYKGSLDLFFNPNTGILYGDDDVLGFNTKVDGYDFKGSFTGMGVENGVVEGKINQDSLIGAFHGDSARNSVAGFIMGEAGE